MIAQVTWTVNAIAVLWVVTVLGILVCGLLFLAFRDHPKDRDDRRKLLAAEKDDE